jgi:hypothetical protein
MWRLLRTAGSLAIQKQSSGSRPRQLLCQNDRQAAQKPAVRLVFVQRAHDLQIPPVVSEANGTPLCEGTQQAAISPPVHIMEKQTPSATDTTAWNGGHVWLLLGPLLPL